MERPHWLTMLSRVSKWEPASGGKAEKAITAAYLAALLLSILAMYVAAKPLVPSLMWNSDMLGFEDYLRDWLVRGYDMKQWSMPGAPNYADMLLYGFFRYATRSVWWADVGFGLSRVAVFVSAPYALLSLISSSSRIQKLRFSLLFASSILLATILYTYGEVPDFILIFLTSHHGGALVYSMFAVLVTLLWLRDPHRRPLWLLLLLLFSIAASLCDRLYTIWFSVPAIGAMLVLVTLRRVSLGSVVLLSAALLGSDVVGQKIYQSIQPLLVVSYSLAPQEGLPAILTWYSAALAGNRYQQFVLFSYICLATLTLYVLARAWKNRGRPSPLESDSSRKTGVLFLLLYAVLILPTCILFMALTNKAGNYYAAGGNLAALALWGFLAALSPLGMRLSKKGMLHIGVLGALFGYLGLLALSVSPSPQSIFAIPDPYSPLVACLDSHATELGGGAGFADYWQARPINLFSKQGLHVDQAYGADLVPFRLVSNSEMLLPRKRTFVITDTPTNLPPILEADVIRIHGPADARFICAGYPVLVYRAGLDANRPAILIETYQGAASAEGGSEFRLTNNRSSNMVGRWEDGAILSTGAPGALLFGPYAALPAGHYSVQWSGQVEPGGPEDVGFVDVTQGPGAIELSSLRITSESLRASSEGELATLEFTLVQDAYDVEFRFFVNAQAMVRVDKILVTRER